MQRQVDIAQAIARKYPEQVVLVTSCSGAGRANVMTVGWVSVASSDPLMFMLGIDEGAYTYELIRQTGQFVVAFPSESMARETLFAGSRHGRGIDKLSEAGLATCPPAAGNAPLIREAVANFECRLVQIIQPGDCPLIIGQVQAAHVHADLNVRRLCNFGRDLLAGARAVQA